MIANYNITTISHMKLNKKQKDIIKEIKHILSTWETSNDIESLSHYDLMTETLDKMEEDKLVDEELRNEFVYHIIKIFKTIKCCR